MKYEFERSLERNEMSIAVVDARRFAATVRSAMRELERTAKCYKLTQERYYLDIQSYLHQMASRLEAKPGGNPCDAKTTAWFAKQPEWVQTTLAQCERCGLWYKPDLGHECDPVPQED